jgi:streptogrisin D
MKTLMSVTVTGALALALVPAAPARAGKPVPDMTVPSDKAAYALMLAQVPIDRLVERIERIDAADKNSSGSGLAGLRSDPARRALDVYWHGAVPASVSSETVAARADGVTVTVIPAPYTRDELLAETKRLADLTMVDDKAAVQLAMIGPKFDGTGLAAGVSGLDKKLPTARIPAQARQLLPTLASAVPVDITATERPRLASRYADTPPFWGGAWMVRTGGGACTTGFGVTGLNGASTYILTANHCGHGEWRSGGNTYFIGNSVTTAVDRPHDSQLLLGNQAGARIYTGEYLGSTNQGSAPVKGAVPSATGGTVCTSGAYSGERCGITVIATGLTINVTGYGQMVHMSAADHPNASAVGNGDSGGPTVSYTTNGVLARGTISAMDPGLVVPCTGVPSGGGRSCSQRVFYPDINRQLAGTGVRLNIG